jgi:hypothetical protein
MRSKGDTWINWGEFYRLKNNCASNNRYVSVSAIFVES